MRDLDVGDIDVEPVCEARHLRKRARAVRHRHVKFNDDVHTQTSSVMRRTMAALERARNGTPVLLNLS